MKAVAQDKPAAQEKSATQEKQASQQAAAAPASSPSPQQLPDDLKRPSAPPGIDPNTGELLYKTIQEDWSSLAIGTSKLKPEPPLVGETYEGEGFTRSLVQVKWRPGDPIELYIVLPKGVKNPPVVLYLYGYKEETDRFRDEQWCQRVTAGGVGAVGFISALSTSRFQSRPLEQWFVSELQESLGSTVHDVHFILDYLQERGDIDMNRVGMWGQSSGATIALLAAAADSRIKAVDALDPWGDWPVWLAQSPIVKEDPKHEDFVKPEFLKRVEPLDPVKWLPTLTSTRVRVQQVMQNQVTPDACKDAIRKAVPKQADFVRFKNVNELSAASRDGKLFDWVKLQVTSVRPAAASGSAVLTQTRPTEEKAHR